MTTTQLRHSARWYILEIAVQQTHLHVTAIRHSMALDMNDSAIVLRPLICLITPLYDLNNLQYVILTNFPFQLLAWHFIVKNLFLNVLTTLVLIRFKT